MGETGSFDIHVMPVNGGRDADMGGRQLRRPLGKAGSQLARRDRRPILDPAQDDQRAVEIAAEIYVQAAVHQVGSAQRRLLLAELVVDRLEFVGGLIVEATKINDRGGYVVLL